MDKREKQDSERDFARSLRFRVPLNFPGNTHDNGQDHKKPDAPGKQRIILQLQNGKQEEVQACLQKCDPGHHPEIPQDGE